MRNIIVIALLFLSTFSFAQNETTTPSVSKNVTGIQVGILGIDMYNETRLHPKVSLRSEFAFNSVIWAGRTKGFLLYPVINIQPKYYYNIKRRGTNGKNITNNAASYVSLQVKYMPDWFVISTDKNASGGNYMEFIPTFGFRRNFAKKFNYEFKVGYGYLAVLTKEADFSGFQAIDLGFKIGYDF